MTSIVLWKNCLGKNASINQVIFCNVESLQSEKRKLQFQNQPNLRSLVNSFFCKLVNSWCDRVLFTLNLSNYRTYFCNCQPKSPTVWIIGIYCVYCRCWQYLDNSRQINTISNVMEFRISQQRQKYNKLPITYCLCIGAFNLTDTAIMVNKIVYMFPWGYPKTFWKITQF